MQRHEIILFLHANIFQVKSEKKVCFHLPEQHYSMTKNISDSVFTLKFLKIQVL